MKKTHLSLMGSSIAKSGFQNEGDIIIKFNNWKMDKEAQQWLVGMGYTIKAIQAVKAIKLSNKYKTDVQVQITVYMKKSASVENISIKLVSNLSGFNQIDKRWVDKYAEMWSIPTDVVRILKLFTGEIPSKSKRKLKDSRRVFFNEMAKKDQSKVLNFFSKKKLLIASDILKGKGCFSVDWVLVVLKFKGDIQWILKPICYVIDFFIDGDVKITSRGSLKIGRITVQRKGGDAGRNTAQMLQFKINPAELVL